MIDLSGKHIFIAGGSRGIGASVARMAAQAGASVSINYVRRADAAQTLVKEIEAFGGRAFAVQADVSNEAQITSALQKAVETLGALSGLVISAGIYEGAPLEQMTVEFWDTMMAVNLKGTFLALKAAAPHFRTQGTGGSVVIYTSTAGQGGSPGFSAYAVTKAAQIIFMRSMAGELAPLKVRVNCIAPAWTETDMATEKIDALGREKVISGFPLGRIGLPEDVAGATCFLLSDLAQFITGSTITVDGGMAMRG
jgi:NAD(P)-dependent dehydrogenase (short-subunit alcohol dehydrogenase family)